MNISILKEKKSHILHRLLKYSIFYAKAKPNVSEKFIFHQHTASMMNNLVAKRHIYAEVSRYSSYNETIFNSKKNIHSI